ncbi:MAG: pilus assembly PilX family protein, partial [Thiobacillaceae bacterium]
MSRHLDAIPRRHQAGMSLVMGLLFLALLALLGLAGMGVAVQEERMAGNAQDRTLAFDAAEAALRDCETVLQGASLPAFNGTNGMYQPAAVGTTPVWESIDWTAAGTARVHGSTPAGAAAAPRCIIEELPPQPSQGGNNSLAAGKPLSDAGMYRITARGVGAKPGTVV